MKKCISMINVDVELFLEELSRKSVPDIDTNIDENVIRVTETLYQCVQKARCVTGRHSVEVTHDRWERMMNDKDDLRIWRAVNWKGEFEGENEWSDKPPDQEFKAFYENILNSPSSSQLPGNTEDAIIIPILDDQITTEEVTQEVSNMKSDKACGLDGLTPGLFKKLPGYWLVLLYFLTVCLVQDVIQTHGPKRKCSQYSRKVTD